MPGYNHYPWCLCGWCYKSGLNGYSPRIPSSALDKASALKKLLDMGVRHSWVACFVKPSPCPVCREPVFYYENVYGSRVFFDRLGKPWPKHQCTDRRKKGANSGTNTPRPMSIREKREVQEISELMQIAEHNPAQEHQDVFKEAPQNIYIIDTALRRGFENYLKCFQVTPRYESPVFFSFASARVSPNSGEFFSFADGRISIYCFNDNKERDLYCKEILEIDFERIMRGIGSQDMTAQKPTTSRP